MILTVEQNKKYKHEDRNRLVYTSIYLQLYSVYTTKSPSSDDDYDIQSHTSINPTTNTHTHTHTYRASVSTLFHL